MTGLLACRWHGLGLLTEQGAKRSSRPKRTWGSPQGGPHSASRLMGFSGATFSGWGEPALCAVVSQGLHPPGDIGGDGAPLYPLVDGGIERWSNLGERGWAMQEGARSAGAGNAGLPCVDNPGPASSR